MQSQLSDLLDEVDALKVRRKLVTSKRLKLSFLRKCFSNTRALPWHYRDFEACPERNKRRIKEIISLLTNLHVIKQSLSHKFHCISVVHVHIPCQCSFFEWQELDFDKEIIYFCSIFQK